MDALILAAGFGSRLRAVEPCKPLTRLHGMSLLHIAAHQLAAVGATRVVVATGYQAEAIERTLPAIADDVGVPIESRRVEDYRQPNGFSVLAGAQDLAGKFLLVMADHVFARPVLEALVDRADPAAGVTLAIDRRTISPLVDPDDATWVQTAEDGRITQIGKNISSYNAVDCGAFLAGPALIEALRAAIHDGQAGSLSDGMQRLADAGVAATVDIAEAWWLDVDDPRALDIANQDVRDHLPEVFPALQAGQ